MSGLVIALIGTLGIVLAAVVTAALANRGAKRVNSGNVTSSTAADLWTQSRSMNDSLLKQLTSTQAQLAATSVELRETARQLAASSVQVLDLGHHIELSDAARQASDKARDEARAETAETRKALAELDLRIRAVHDDVKTGNAQSIGNLVDNNESRRISEIPEVDRTAMERDHIDTVGSASSRANTSTGDRH